MKYGWNSILAVFVVGMSSVVMADEGPQFLDDTASLMVRCSVLPVAYSSQGRKMSGNLRSVCADVQAFDNAARFVLNGVIYFASLQDSTYSDGGDLNDLTVTREDGTQVAHKESILAYGDVLLALAYPRTDFREEFDDSLLSR